MKTIHSGNRDCEDARDRGALGPLGFAVRAVCLLLAVGCVAMTPAAANQRQYPIVALTCGDDLRLCRALVQSLSDLAPRYLYRINPKPVPPRAFDLRLNVTRVGAVQLRWPGGGGEPVLRAGQSTSEFARHIVKASPGLVKDISKT